MAFAPRVILALTLAAGQVVAQAPPASETREFRDWIAGKEAGGSLRTVTRGPEGVRMETHEWMRLERLGIPTTQDLVQTVLKRPDGSLQFTFSLSLSQEPLQGAALWSPAAPGKLVMTFKGLPPRTLDLPAGAVIWPGQEEELLKAAARDRRPVDIRGYSVPTQQPTRMELRPVGPDPLPGFPGTVRFQGTVAEGPLVEEVEVWISPEAGEVKQLGSLGGIPFLSQAKSLPAPPPEPGGVGYFERTLKRLPPHPFLPWLRTAAVRWEGEGVPTVPEDAQQRRLGENRYALARPEPPTPAEAAEPPVKGTPSPEDAPYLAQTPLVQFRDPVFDGLLRRLDAPAGAGRWELARRVSAFVYDWIEEKDYTVGFASAQEVARNPRGDCTEHGVLAVALLRRLGVPARGVVGWIGVEGGVGLHFWAEVRLGARWVPLDPTFDMAPASAFRIKLRATDLADLGSVAWDDAASSFRTGAWVPEGPWAADVRIQGDTVHAPGLDIRLPGSRWSCSDGRLELDGLHRVLAAPRPMPAQRVRLLQGHDGRRGWFGNGSLWVECGSGDWLRLDSLEERDAFRILDILELRRRD